MVIEIRVSKATVRELNNLIAALASFEQMGRGLTGPITLSEAGYLVRLHSQIEEPDFDKTFNL